MESNCSNSISERSLRYSHRMRTRLLIDCEGTARSRSSPSESPPKSGSAAVNVPPRILPAFKYFQVLYQNRVQDSRTSNYMA